MIIIQRAVTDTLQVDCLSPVQRTGGFHGETLHRVMAASSLLRKLALGLMFRLELAILGGHKNRSTLQVIKDARRGRESLLSANEAFTLHAIASAQAGLHGEMAEVGVYQGCSARIISTASGGVPLHLFDTFSGLPEPGAAERARLSTGLYAASLASVREFLADRRNISFHPGRFPQTAMGCTAEAFSFVHLDVDLKSSTLDCLDYFYPRMVPGGIILTHDYSYLDGVRDAFVEFLALRPERLIELPSSQAMFVKL
jgi:O-methyltransferase